MNFDEKFSLFSKNQAISMIFLQVRQAPRASSH